MALTRVPVAPALLTWAQRRGGHDSEVMRRKFKRWDLWLAGEQQPTLKQLEELARFGHVPFGALLLPEPPPTRLPIDDFRVGRGSTLKEPSQDLLDVIHQCQRRQDWYHGYAERYGLESQGFLRGNGPSGVEEAAATIRSELGFDVERRRNLQGADAARKHLIQHFEALGGLAVVSSMVGNDTHRILDIGEVRGFTLHDDTVPLVFVNAADTKRGQVFSLAHEFAHVLRGESGVSAEHELEHGQSTVERWCNAVASEFLVPGRDLRQRFNPEIPLSSELDRLADMHLCSTLVVLIRLRDLHMMTADNFDDVYQSELRRLIDLSEGAGQSGGDFYLNQPFRVGETLSRAVIGDALEGGTPIRDALRLLGFRSVDVMDKYAERLGLR